MLLILGSKETMCPGLPRTVPHLKSLSWVSSTLILGHCNINYSLGTLCILPWACHAPAMAFTHKGKVDVEHIALTSTPSHYPTVCLQIFNPKLLLESLHISVSKYSSVLNKGALKHLMPSTNMFPSTPSTCWRCDRKRAQ